MVSKNKNISDIQFDKDGNLWATGWWGLAYKIENEKITKNITMEDGLSLQQW